MWSGGGVFSAVGGLVCGPIGGLRRNPPEVTHEIVDRPGGKRGGFGSILRNQRPIHLERSMARCLEDCASAPNSVLVEFALFGEL